MEAIQIMNSRPTCFFEALTQVVATYVYDVNEGRQPSLDRLKGSAALLSKNAGTVGSAVIDALASTYHDDPSGTIILLANSLFTGDITTLKNLYEINMNKTKSFLSFDDLLSMAMIKDPYEYMGDRFSRLIGPSGAYRPEQQEIVVGLLASETAKWVSSRMMSLDKFSQYLEYLLTGGKQKEGFLSDMSEGDKEAFKRYNLKQILLHEFTHLLTFYNWSKYGYATELSKKFVYFYEPKGI